MARDYRLGIDHIARVLEHHSQEELFERLQPKTENPAPRVPGGAKLTEGAIERRWKILNQNSKSDILDPDSLQKAEIYEKNIENYIGTVKVPIGLAGPLRVNGVFAQGDYYIPLATTEAALVASYNRGAMLISAAGGCTSVLLSEGVSRAPGFQFQNVLEAGRFVAWCLSNLENFREQAESTTRHGKLVDMKLTVEGNHVFINFEYITGDASGQNMVTIATDAILDFILANSPAKPEHYFIEANLSGDKKATSQSFQSVRGKKVTAEITISKEMVEKFLHTTPEKLVKYAQMSTMGGVLSGTIGIQGHYANGLAALYMACGQDVACVAESAIGVTRYELTGKGDLYTSVTLPNLMIGTVGGGTGLPSQKAALDLMGLSGANNARALAEVCAGLALAGELSICGAICAQHFCRAHQRLARGKEARV